MKEAVAETQFFFIGLRKLLTFSVTRKLILLPSVLLQAKEVLFLFSHFYHFLMQV